MSAERRSWVRSIDEPVLDMGWPLRSDSPVSEALGTSPVKDLNYSARANRPGRPITDTTTGPPTSATPGRDRAIPWGSTLR